MKFTVLVMHIVLHLVSYLRIPLQLHLLFYHLIIEMSATIRFVLSFILASPWIYFTDSSIYKHNKYLIYYRFFEKKSSIWKRTSLILGILAMIETLCLPVIIWFGAYCYVNYLGYSL